MQLTDHFVVVGQLFIQSSHQFISTTFVFHLKGISIVSQSFIQE